MFRKMLPVVAAGIALSLSACAGEETPKVASLQKKDKTLSCSEVQLEINEAEFYRKTAENNKNPNVKSLIMPLGYISTYVNADEAAGAAQARIEYLNRIYDILNCDDPASKARSARNTPSEPEVTYGGGYAPNPARYAPPQEQYYRQPTVQQQSYHPGGAEGYRAYQGRLYNARPDSSQEELYW